MSFSYHAARVNEHADDDFPAYWGIFAGCDEHLQPSDWLVDDDYGMSFEVATATAALFQALWPQGWNHVNYDAVAQIMRGIGGRTK